MSLTNDQKALIRTSFQKISLHSDEVAASFYKRLFDLDPFVRPLFKSDMRDQQRKFMQTVGTLVAALEMPGQFMPMVAHLGKRHTAYHVEREHYAVVGKALLWAFEQALGPDFTPEVRQAWTEAYELIAETAIEAAY
jgi:hemoglobin-like flavoprotein